MPAVVQHAGTPAAFTTGTTGTASSSFAANTTAGNCLVAIFSLNGATATPTVVSVTTNGVAENWVLAKADPDGFIYWYMNPNTGGGQKIVDITIAFGFTATTSNSACVVPDIYEVSGLGTTVTVDRTITADQDATPGTTWSSGPTLTTTQPSEIWFGAVAVSPSAANTASTITPAGAWTNEATISSSIQAGGTSTSDKFETFQLSGFQVVSSTGTATYNGTCSASSFWNAGAITLYGSGGTLPGAAALDGGGTLTAAGDAGAAAQLHGAGTLTAAGGVSIPGAAALHGAGTLTAGAAIRVPGAAQLHGGGTLTASPTYTTSGAAQLHGGGTVHATATVTAPGGTAAAPPPLDGYRRLLRRRAHRILGMRL